MIISPKVQNQPLVTPAAWRAAPSAAPPTPDRPSSDKEAAVHIDGVLIGFVVPHRTGFLVLDGSLRHVARSKTRKLGLLALCERDMDVPKKIRRGP